PTLTGSYSRSWADAGELPSRSAKWAAEALLSYPILSGGPTATYYSVLASRRSLEKAEEDLRTTREAAVVDLETSWSAYARADDEVKVSAALLDAAVQRNDEADIRYNSGLLSFDNWELIVTDRVNAERAALSARLTAATAQAAWERALGKGLGEQ
ncbi:MAG: TolC family protein, partial [Elusimicrobia bacterium]|nr:TolC family protein [Elusimicrobiota bacterium]